MTEPKNTAALEKRIGRLEEIVSALEREDLELDEALRLFEEGIGHLRDVRVTLEAAELRIERLLETADGGYATEPASEE